MRTKEIDAQLAQDNEALAAAQSTAAQAAEKLSRSPSSPEARTAVVLAQRNVAEIQVGIDALQAARREMKRLDQSDEVKAMRENRAKAGGIVVREQAGLINCAVALDEAFAKLLAAAKAFKAQSDVAREAVAKYLDLNETDLDTRSHHSEMLGRVSSRIAHGFSMGMYHAAQASDLDMNEYVTFNPFQVSNGESIAGNVLKIKMEDATRDNAKRISSGIRVVENVHA